MIIMSYPAVVVIVLGVVSLDGIPVIGTVLGADAIGLVAVLVPMIDIIILDDVVDMGIVMTIVIIVGDIIILDDVVDMRIVMTIVIIVGKMF